MNDLNEEDVVDQQARRYQEFKQRQNKYAGMSQDERQKIVIKNMFVDKVSELKRLLVEYKCNKLPGEDNLEKHLEEFLRKASVHIDRYIDSREKKE